MEHCTECRYTNCDHYGSDNEACSEFRPEAIRSSIPLVYERGVGFLPAPEVHPLRIIAHHTIAEEIATLLDCKRADYGTENIKKFGSQGVLVQ